MDHFTDAYAEFINETLHYTLPSTWFYKQEIYQVADVATALLVTYDSVADDHREYHVGATWEQFISRMAKVKSDWADFSKEVMLRFGEHPSKTMLGWEGRTILFHKGWQQSPILEPRHRKGRRRRVPHRQLHVVGRSDSISD